MERMKEPKTEEGRTKKMLKKDFCVWVCVCACEREGERKRMVEEDERQRQKDRENENREEVRKGLFVPCGDSLSCLICLEQRGMRGSLTGLKKG